MADNKKYYYIRLKENFFDSENIVIIENMKNGINFSNILLKLYLKSLKTNGRLMVNDIIPYDTKMIATITRQKEKIVKEALEVFKEYGLVEVLENGAIYMCDIQNLIGKSTTEADRKREYDRRVTLEKKSLKNVGEISEKCVPEIRDKRLEIRDKKRDKRENADYQQIADMYNEICISFPRITKLSDSRKKAIKARLNQYAIEDFRKLFQMAEESSFLKGQNSRDWIPNFDWLVKDANMAKVLDGNYTDRRTAQGETGEGGGEQYRSYEEFEKELRESLGKKGTVQGEGGTCGKETV